VQNFIDGMYVAPDGTIYTNSVWDEGAKGGIYKNKDTIGRTIVNCMAQEDPEGSCHTSSKYLYVSMKQAAFDKPGQDYPHPGQLGMLSDATPIRSACRSPGGAMTRAC